MKQLTDAHRQCRRRKMKVPSAAVSFLFLPFLLFSSFLFPSFLPYFPFFFLLTLKKVLGPMIRYFFHPCRRHFSRFFAWMRTKTKGMMAIERDQTKRTPREKRTIRTCTRFLNRGTRPLAARDLHQYCEYQSEKKRRRIDRTSEQRFASQF